MVNFFDYYFHAHAHDLTDEAGPEAVARLLVLAAKPPTRSNYSIWRTAPSPGLRRAGSATFSPPNTATISSFFIPALTSVASTTARAAPALIASRSVPAGMRVVTFIARRLDQLRGFDRFVTLANRLLRERSDVVCVAVGETVVDRGLDMAFFGATTLLTC